MLESRSDIGIDRYYYHNIFEKLFHTKSVNSFLRFVLIFKICLHSKDRLCVQIYTRVPTQAHSSHHESDTSQHKSTQVNTILTRVNMSQHEFKTRLREKEKRDKIWLKEKTKCNLSMVLKTTFTRI